MIVSRRRRRRLYVDREKEEQGEKSNEKDKRARDSIVEQPPHRTGTCVYSP